ncbi:LuxR C-terminal-related transcriptional regulator [Streptomyces sp. NPDC012769]|uniref:LuxR C-terminal-related transcriptional regulator n=1 Tax=Streptomyces sp. NPDC012769 TaxID=3364848 RepID=UPI0036C38398
MNGATPAAAPGPRLYDRAPQLAAVASLSARTVEGSGGVLFVTGDPGTGRSTLLARAAHDFPGTAHRVAAPGHRVPWSGARALLTALAPTASAARRALRQARGEAGLGTAVAGLVSAPAASAPNLASGRGPGVLVCVDDLHLWDAHSRAALAAAWQDRRRAGRPGTGWLVSAARHHRLPEVPGAGAVRLGRLGPAGARALVRDLSPVPVAPEVLDRLLQEAAGHPGVIGAAVRRLGPDRLSGTVPLSPSPLVDATVLHEVYGGLLSALPADSRRLLALVAALPGGSSSVPVDTVLAAARAARTPVDALDGLIADGLLHRADDTLRFTDVFLARTALLRTAPVPRTTSAPPASPRTDRTGDIDPPRSVTARAVDTTRAESHRGEARRSEADGADRLGPPAATRDHEGVGRGRLHLLHGRAALTGGPVAEAYEALTRAAALLREGAPVEAADARFLAMEAAWAAGDAAGCLAALDDAGGARGTERDFAEGLRAALDGRLGEARGLLTRVVAVDGAEDEPRVLLRAGSAALVLGATTAAARLHARALTLARAEDRATLLPHALEHLAYAELRAGRYGRAARHAREGLGEAERTGQANVAAHQHAVLALVASVTEDGPGAAEHAERALATARSHGLVQAATLAEWALARADLGRGLAAQAAARLVPLVRTGPRGGHFALRMLAVPCFVEAAVASGRYAEARAATEEYAVWAAQGLDRPAPARLARCRALLADGTRAAYWFQEAVRRHDADCGNDFERARTLLAYGSWLRRRRRPSEARGPLRDALVTFERAAATGWAERTRAELRATGGEVAGAADRPAAWGELTPQQQRIARLAAQGATTREIADRLVLSPRTIDHHLRNIYARLQIRSRVQLPGVLKSAGPDGDAAAARR